MKLPHEIRPLQVLTCLLLIGIPASVFYIVSIEVLKASGLEVSQIIRDTAQITNTSSFLGFVSNVGFALWISAAAISFYSTTLQGNQAHVYKELLWQTGLLSLALAIDDFFMIHDRYINQKICYLFYAIITFLILFRHFKLLLAIAGLPFFIAGALLAASVLTDLVQAYSPLNYQLTQVIEEGLKFNGVVFWLYFICKLGKQASNNSQGTTQLPSS